MAKRSMEEEKEYHRRYFRAVNHPLRTQILRLLQEQDMTVKQMATRLSIDVKSLSWHLELLEYGHCIAHDQKGIDVIYMITKEGNVINYLERS